MKKIYEVPVLLEEKVEIEDIIAASGFAFKEEGDHEEFWPGFGDIWG